MLLAFIFAILVVSLNFFGIDVTHTKFMTLISHIDFSQVVLQGILCFLLFSGGKNVSIKKLIQYKWDVITLAIIGILLATFFIGSLIYLSLNLIGLHITYIYALTFGAIISPTDPIAALAILKSVGLPQNIEVIIDGESQFNDGVGVVIFTALLSISAGQSHPEISHIFSLFFQEVLLKSF